MTRQSKPDTLSPPLSPWLLGVIFLAPMLGWISFLGVMAATFRQLIRRKVAQPSVRGPGVTRLAALVLAGFLLTVLLSNWLHHSPVPWWSHLKFVLPILAPCFLAGLFQQAHIEPSTIRTWALRSVWCTVIVTTGEYLYFTQYLHVLGYRARALSANPLFVSAMLVPMMFLVWLNIEAQSPRQRWTTLATFAVGILCLSVVLGARMSVLIVIALVPGLVWYVFKRVPAWRSHATPILLATLLLVPALGALLAWTSPIFIERLGRILEFMWHPNLNQFADESIRLRAAHWSAGWQAFMDQPWVGYGFENERSALGLHQAPGAPILSTSHQQYLTFALGAGLPGLLTGLLYVFLPLILACRGQRNSQYIYAASALAMPIALNGLTDTFFDDIRLLSYYTVMTLLVACTRYPIQGVNGPPLQTSRPV